MTDEARDAIIDNPLRQNISSTGEVNGALYEADFLTADDLSASQPVSTPQTKTRVWLPRSM